MAVVTTNLGVITAYGDAVAAGYTGTKAQWQALMADYATVGQQAAQSAQTASTAATTATTAATTATTAASTATTKASEASASATAAEQAAASISTPDTTLTQSGKAADAKKTGDEISQIKEDFNDIDRELNGRYSLPLEWEQGNLNYSGEVSNSKVIRTGYFSTTDVQKITVSVGAGFVANICKYSGNTNPASQLLGYIELTSGTHEVIPDGTYSYIRFKMQKTESVAIVPTEGVNLSVAYHYDGSLKSDFNNMVNSVYVTDSASGSVAHFVDGADDVPMKSVKVNIAPVQSGSGDPSPENARPISGWDSVKVTGHGRNFCKCIVKTIKQNKNGLTATPNGDGSITINGTCTGTLVLYFNLATEGGDGIGTGQGNGMKNLPNGTYRFGALPSGVRLQIYGSNVPNATSADARFISDSTRGTFTITGAYRYNWVRMSVSVDTVLDNATIYPALYLASDTDDTYEPYNGNTYTISLSSAGTVYGGTLDAVSGVLTVTHGYIASYIGQTLPSTWISDRDVYVEGARPTTGAQVVYQLATPLTYQLSAQEIKSLLGINNVWSDAGDMDVEYRADTKLYIDKRLAEALA